MLFGLTSVVTSCTLKASPWSNITFLVGCGVWFLLGIGLSFNSSRRFSISKYEQLNSWSFNKMKLLSRFNGNIATVCTALTLYIDRDFHSWYQVVHFPNNRALGIAGTWWKTSSKLWILTKWRQNLSTWWLFGRGSSRRLLVCFETTKEGSIVRCSKVIH